MASASLDMDLDMVVLVTLDMDLDMAVLATLYSDLVDLDIQVIDSINSNDNDCH